MRAVSQLGMDKIDFITRIAIATPGVTIDIWVTKQKLCKTLYGFQLLPLPKFPSSCMRSRVFLCHVGETVIADSDSGKATFQLRAICGLVQY